MDRNSVTGFILIAAILIGYTWYTMPSAEQQALEQRTRDSLAQVDMEQRALEAERSLRERGAPDPDAPTSSTATLSATDTTDQALADSLRNAASLQRLGVFSAASEGTTDDVTIENERMQVSFRTHGAAPSVIRLKEYSTYPGTPLYLTDPDSSEYEFRFFLGNLDLSTNDLHFKAVRKAPDHVVFTAPTTDPAKYLQLEYRLDEETYFMHVQARFVGMQGEVDPRNLMFRWNITGFNNEKHRESELQKSGVYFKYFSDGRDYLSESDADEKTLQGRTNWVAFKQDFFTVAMISEEGFANGSEIAITPLEDPRYTKHYAAKLFFEKERNADASLDMRFYMGPNHFGTLRRTEIPEFDHIIDLGWGIFGWMNQWIVIPIFNWLNGWGWNYGIIILVLTLVIKLLLMPLTYKNLVASAKMRVMKPEIDTINEKHKDGDALKKQQATMDLYRKAGVNPASGCVPMLIQMPILYAMFRFFPSSIELRQEKFLWADDLSSYDSILDLPFTIPMYGDHVSLFTLLMALSTVFYTMINQQQMPTQQGMPNMKVIMYLFPVMMLFFLNSFSAGLSYYYLLANIISILQMTLLKKWFVDEDKLRAQLLLNMKTPRKKGRWQQRLEDIQKQQQAQQGKRRKR